MLVNFKSFWSLLYFRNISKKLVLFVANYYCDLFVKQFFNIVRRLYRSGPLFDYKKLKYGLSFRAFYTSSFTYY